MFVQCCTEFWFSVRFFITVTPIPLDYTENPYLLFSSYQIWRISLNGIKINTVYNSGNVRGLDFDIRYEVAMILLMITLVSFEGPVS